MTTITSHKIPLMRMEENLISAYCGKSLFRPWNQLSRLQKNLARLCLLLFVLICLFLFADLRHKIKNNDDQFPDSSPNVWDKWTEEGFIRTEAREGQSWREKSVDNKGKNVRNRVEAVHQVVVEDEEHNEEDEGDIPENNDPNKYNSMNDDSNHAGKSLINNGYDYFELPPKDGSLKFKGPCNGRQKAVVKAFKFAWTKYKKYAWGHDHLRPISRTHQNWFGLGLTLIDSLDTMYIMNLRQEFNEARNWVASSLNFTIDKEVNLFETTIRVLGGLLSAYHLSADKMFLDKALDLGHRLMGSFSSPTGIAYSDVNLKNKLGHSPKWSPDSSTSEVSSIQLEFRDLSRSVQDPAFETAAAKISEKIHTLEKVNGLVPIFISANSGNFRKGSTISLGARGDSYYEYLLKQWIQTGKRVDYLKQDFLDAIVGVAKLMAKRTTPNRLLFVGELLNQGQTFKPKMDELVCFLPGTLALASHHGLEIPSLKLPPKGVVDSPQTNLLMYFAEELAYTCYLTFARQPTSLGAEITYFNVAGKKPRHGTDDFYVNRLDAHYLLRPETIESLFYLYYVTRNKTYQDWGWNIFIAIEKFTKVADGYTSIGNVRDPHDLKPKDMMESFFLGETLKYFYLLFSNLDEHEIDLNRWIFNTEAHLLPIRKN